jgi:4-alpha-glucanotransferase
MPKHRWRNQWRKLPACEATRYRKLEACATENPDSYFSSGANVYSPASWYTASQDQAVDCRGAVVSQTARGDVSAIIPLDDDDEHVVEEYGGIIPAYKDTSEQWCHTSPETRNAILLAMRLDPANPADDAGPDVRVLNPGRTITVTQPSELVLEDGTRLRVDRQTPPDLPIGYHQLQTLDGIAETWIIQRPASCWLPPGLQAWGWAVQLYAARSAMSWGIGDLGDLRRLAIWSRHLRADVLLLNPLCAVAPEIPQEASPYYPSSRRFRNPLYLRIEDLPGAREAAIDWSPLAAAAQSLNDARRIDRDQVFRLKMEALEKIWRRHARDSSFDRYCQTMGESLRGFASFCVLAERYGGDWRLWPREYQRPDSPDVLRFVQQASHRLRFHQWLQWQLERQLAASAAVLPLVIDLPIGVSPGGADAWQWQDVLAKGATVGAPPDQFNMDGQDWSLPPFIPHRLRAARYRPFVETIRSSLRHAGGLRIDHVMGLFRLYWIPQGLGPKRGAYVRYPSEEMLAIVAVESHRARAWIAGEDLGTVETHVRRRLAENRMLSYKLLWFEDQPPSEFPELALAAVSTHDLPTVAGLWSGGDFAAQQRIGLQPNEDGFQQIRDRLLAATAVSESAAPAEVVAGAYQALGRAPSTVLAASLDDALAVEERPNMPGTTVQWPNWSLALPQPLEVIESLELPRQIADGLKRTR